MLAENLYDPNLVEIRLIHEGSDRSRNTAEMYLFAKLLESLTSGKVMRTLGQRNHLTGELMLLGQSITQVATNGLNQTISEINNCNDPVRKADLILEMGRNLAEKEEAFYLQELSQYLSPGESKYILIVSPFPSDMSPEYANNRGYFIKERKSAIRMVEIRSDGFDITQVFVDTPDQTALKIAMRAVGFETHFNNVPTDILAMRLEVNSGKSLSKFIEIYDLILERRFKRVNQFQKQFFCGRADTQQQYSLIEKVNPKLDRLTDRAVNSLMKSYTGLKNDLENGYLSNSNRSKVWQILNSNLHLNQHQENLLWEASISGECTSELIALLAYLELNIASYQLSQEIGENSGPRFGQNKPVMRNNYSTNWGVTLGNIVNTNSFVSFCGFGFGGRSKGNSIVSSAGIPIYMPNLFFDTYSYFNDGICVGKCKSYYFAFENMLGTCRLCRNCERLYQ